MTDLNKSELLETVPGWRTQAFPMLVSLVTPATVILTGMLYLAGYAMKSAILSNFGLSPGMFEEPIQATLARGFPPLILGMTAFLLVYGALWAVELRGDIFRKTQASMAYDEGSTSGLTFSRISLRRLTTIFSTAFVGLSIAAVSGHTTGDRKSLAIKIEVNSGCHSGCFKYSTQSQRFIGRLIAQDTKNLAIYTQQGIHIIKNDQLVSISRFLRPPTLRH